MAQYSLGLMYTQGRSVPQNDAEAVRWYRLATEQGHPVAQYNLGVSYAEGRGVPQDDAEAVRWYQLATEQGDAEAQLNLGFMYVDGRGVPQDDAEAARLSELAAEQVLAEAQDDFWVTSVQMYVVAIVFGVWAGIRSFVSLLYCFPKALMLTLKNMQACSLPLPYLEPPLFYLVIFGILYYLSLILPRTPVPGQWEAVCGDCSGVAEMIIDPCCGTDFGTSGLVRAIE